MTNLAAKLFTYKTAWSHKLLYIPLFISLNYHDYQSCNGMLLFAGFIPSLLENNIMFSNLIVKSNKKIIFQGIQCLKYVPKRTSSGELL